MSDVLAELFEAHVRYELSLWQGAGLAGTLAERVGALFRWSASVKLDELVTRTQIMGVIERYVIELRVSGGITELSGEMSNVVFTSRATANARLHHILTPEMYEQFADKVLALEGVRRELVALIARSETARTIGTRLLARGLLDLVAQALPNPSALTPATPLAFARKLESTILPALERHIGESLARRRERLTQDAEQRMLELLDSERLRSVIDDVWERVATRSLAEIFAFVGEQDVEDFVVLVHEFWLRYRKTEFFRTIATEMVDYFFAKYGRTSLATLIDDMGVSEGMVTHEILALWQPILEHAARSGALEAHVRTRLQGFYSSLEAATALGQSSSPRGSDSDT